MDIIDRVDKIASNIVAARPKIEAPRGDRKDWKITYPNGKVEYSKTKPNDAELGGDKPTPGKKKAPVAPDGKQKKAPAKPDGGGGNVFQSLRDQKKSLKDKKAPTDSGGGQGVHEKDMAEIRETLKKELGGKLPDGIDDIIKEEVTKLRGEMDKAKPKAKPKTKPKPKPKVDKSSVFTPEEMGLPERAVQPVKTEKAVFAQAKKAQKDMMKLLNQGNGLDKAIGAKHYNGAKGEKPNLNVKGPIIITAPLKGKERSKEKVESDYGGDWSQLKDAVRASVGVDSFDEVKGVVTKLKEMGMEIAQKPKDRFAKPTSAGYRDIMLNVKYPNGHVGEIQVHLKSILKAKKQAHKDYEVVRTIEGKASREGRKYLTDEEQSTVDKMNEKMKKAYEDAWKVGMDTPKAKAASTTRVAAKTMYMEMDGNPVIIVYKKFPVMFVKGKERTYYNYFKLYHEGEELSKAEFEALKKETS